MSKKKRQNNHQYDNESFPSTPVASKIPSIPKESMSTTRSRRNKKLIEEEGEKSQPSTPLKYPFKTNQIKECVAQSASKRGRPKKIVQLEVEEDDEEAPKPIQPASPLKQNKFEEIEVKTGSPIPSVTNTEHQSPLLTNEEKETDQNIESISADVEPVIVIETAINTDLVEGK